MTTSAPGKLVLLGEYAVLFGHPALVMAVDRRARVDIRFVHSRSWRVMAPGFCDDEASFNLDPDRGFSWCAPGSLAAQQLVLVERVVDSLVTAKLLDPYRLRPAAITLDTGDFFLRANDGRAKLGLGSSAALTVALTDALRRWGPDKEQRPPLDLAELLDLHRSFQGGRGSGIDLAASVLGGVTEYRLTDDLKTPDARAANLPRGIEVVYLWTGRSASTEEFLARLDAGIRSDGASIVAALGGLGRISAAGIDRIRAGDIAGFLDDVDDFAVSMEELGSAAGIPVLSEEHLRLQALAHEFGVRYKPSGAGGGDVGLGFTDDPDVADAFSSRAREEGFTPLDLHIDPNGCRLDG